ncbi:hypothetical protein F4779DRAFT_108888 [Xylariaceae sp. FL0662B]|nr:hypothetical protein F4779DRAFT_108888 [Xylariaceae sp. FL0662B]
MPKWEIVDSESYRVRPRLRQLLIVTFLLCYENREHYDAKNDEAGMTEDFLSLALSSIQPRMQDQQDPGSASDFPTESTSSTAEQAWKLTGPPAASLQYLNADTLRRLVNTYISARREFHRRSLERERLRMLKGSKGDGRNVDDDGDEEMAGVEDSALVVEEDHDTDDEDDLFVYQQLEYAPEEHSKKENRLVKYVDRWTDWVDEQKGDAVAPSLIGGLMIF